MTQYAPADEAGIRDVVAAAYADRTPLLVQGAGSKASVLRQVQAAHTLSTAAVAGITLYSPKELIVSVRAGTRLKDLQAELEKSGQHMIAEPPDYGHLLDSPANPTLGGLVGANLSGPRRIAGGAMRDHVLGVRAVNGAGELIKSGGRVLKNVTGLDVCKLLAGSYGTLAVMTELTFKVLPAPEDTASVVFQGQTPEQAVATLSAALGSPYGVTGAAYLPQTIKCGPTALTIARIEDFAASVSYRSNKLRQDLAEFGTAGIMPARESRMLWDNIRDAHLLSSGRNEAIWRISVRPSRGPDLLAAAESEGARGYLDWGGGLVMLAGPSTEATHVAITEAVKRAGGVWTVLRAPAAWRDAAHLIPPEAPALAVISRRVKAAFDPAGILNPGRMFAGV
jgi:glycolate oxidase FAD binding subunit